MPSSASAERLGRIIIPAPAPTDLVFPLITDYPAKMAQSWPVVTHRFQSEATLATQRFFVGTGPRKFDFIKGALSHKERDDLLVFFNAVSGSWQSFLYDAPNPDSTLAAYSASSPPAYLTTRYRVIFDTQPLSISSLANMCQVGMTFVECPDSTTAESKTIIRTDTRFPGELLNEALTSQVQEIIPLVHIQVRDHQTDKNHDGVPDIYLSDRRIEVGGNHYLPRLLNIGEQGSDVIMTQDIRGSADNVRFVFGNADRAMSLLVQDTSLKYASIDLCLYHVQSAVLLQLWKGFILSWSLDGSAEFSVQCSDGLYPVTQSYPKRVITRTCWKTFDDGINCPYAAKHLPGRPGDPNVCDFQFDSVNGCLAHGMERFFGGHPTFPQSVVIKDNGTGIIGGIGRSTVTSTSIVAEAPYGRPLPEIWCNDGGNPLNAFWANAIPIAVRDESDFEDVLGIVGAGPLDTYEGMSVQHNADGYPVLVTPMADGNPPHGFKIDSNFEIKSNQPKLGWRGVLGNDPAKVYIGQVSVIANGSTVTWLSGDDFSSLSAGSEIWVGGVAMFVDRLLSNTSLVVSNTTFNTGVNRSWGTTAEAFSLGEGGGGLPQNWEVPSKTYDNPVTGHSHYIFPYAAGTAFAEIRIPKPSAKGITPTTAESHTAVVPIARGLTGVTFDNPEDPANIEATVVPGLNNPFWVAVNTFWRALGIDKADPPTRIDSIVLDSIYKGDGSGAAEIADKQVAPLVGDPEVLETQFQFQGELTEFKPFRDWLTEILTCALGYFTFEFGKLRLGIREHARDMSAFTPASMLYQSLSLAPAAEAFEYLKLSFANSALQGQIDEVVYEDKDHSEYFNRQGVPLTSTQRSVGMARISQALRCVATRTREEIGGILRPDQPNPHIEWDNNHIATFKTTILSLETGVGDVISITAPDIPSYPGPMAGSPGADTYLPQPANTWNYRIIRWTLHKDWSVTIQAKSVTDSMYDLVIGPKPTDVEPPDQPILYFPEPLGQWAPFEIHADLDDALFPDEYNFRIEEVYVALATGTVVNVTAEGKLPVNSFIPNCGTPDIKQGKITYSDTGGTLKGGGAYFTQVCAKDALGRFSPPSQVLVVKIPEGTDTNSFTIENIIWPFAHDLTGFAVFVSQSEELICKQFDGGLGGAPEYTPRSIGVTGPFQRSTFSIPNPYVGKLRFKAKPLLHGGVAGLRVIIVPDDTSIVCSALLDLSPEAFDATGRVLSIVGRPGITMTFTGVTVSGGDAVYSYSGMTGPSDALVGAAITITGFASAGNNVTAIITATAAGTITVAATTQTDETHAGLGTASAPTPWESYNISAFDASSGTITFDRPHIILVDDAVEIRTKADAPNVYPFLEITDSGYINKANFGTGLTVDAEIGNRVRVIAGKGRGETPVKITSNTATTLHFDSKLELDETSIWIIESPNWFWSSDTNDLHNADPLKPISFAVPVSNYVQLPILMGGFPVTKAGAEAPDDGVNCIREDWIFGDASGATQFVQATGFQLNNLAIRDDAAPHRPLEATYLIGRVVSVAKQDLTEDFEADVFSDGVLIFHVSIPAGAPIDQEYILNPSDFLLQPLVLGKDTVQTVNIILSDENSDYAGIVVISIEGVLNAVGSAGPWGTAFAFAPTSNPATM